MSFKNPSVLWHLTWIPLLVTFAFFAAYKLRKRRLKSIIHDDDQLKKLTMNLSPVKRYARQLISLTIVILVLLTLAQPQWGEKTRVKEAWDLYVLFDVSRSMLAADTAPDRLSHGKTVVRELAMQRSNDRLALNSFAGRAFPNCPLTTNRNGFLLSVREFSPMLL